MTDRIKALEDALRKLELANDRVCAARPQRVYNLMIAGGMTEALLDLDCARADARAALAASQPAPVRPTECASDGCGNAAAVHFIRGDIGSYYCMDCYLRIHKQTHPALAANQPAPTAYRAVPTFTSGRASDTAPVGQPAQQVQPGAPITLTYTNWKGETAQRTIIPRRVRWGSTEWHPEPQWLLTAFDVDKEAERDFALKDFGQTITVQDAARNGIYVASKAKYGSEWKAMRDAGWPIVSTWIDESGQGETRDWPDLWSRCVSEAANSAALVIIAREDDALKGAWVELGAALAAGIPVFAVGISQYSIRHHPRVAHYEREDDAFTAAMRAIAEGRT